MSNFLIVGASRGLGLQLAKALPGTGDRAWLLSRSRPPIEHSAAQIEWIESDLRDPEAAATKARLVVGDEPIHCFIHNAGIWETETLAKTDLGFLLDVMNVNLISALALVKLLEPNLRAGRGTLILMGSTCGLENEGADIPAYVASKFGLRGLTHALRERFRNSMVRVTCISPGSMASTTPGEGADDRRRIPIADMVKLFRCLLELSPASCPKEIVIPATLDDDV